MRSVIPDALPPDHAATPFDVVVIAASFGGVSALRELLAALPPDFPAAVLIQMHLPPDQPSSLVEVLQWGARLPVVWGQHLELAHPGSVVVVPPGQHMQILPDGRLLLTPWTKRAGRKPQADDLFTSAAISFGPRAIGVVLTGYLSDGARGARAIVQGGGRVLAQDPNTAASGDMPRAAIATGCVDFVLTLDAIPAALVSLTMVRGVSSLFAVPTAPSQPYRVAVRTWRS
ncbi:MAG: hypothetical protein OHK0022_23100 [Roseiflexaceae bacterium]